MEYFIYLVPVFAIIGLIVMAFKAKWVIKQDAGDKNMQELATQRENHIQQVPRLEVAKSRN